MPAGQTIRAAKPATGETVRAESGESRFVTPTVRSAQPSAAINRPLLPATPTPARPATSPAGERREPLPAANPREVTTPTPLRAATPAAVLPTAGAKPASAKPVPAASPAPAPAPVISPAQTPAARPPVEPARPLSEARPSPSAQPVGAPAAVPTAAPSPVPNTPIQFHDAAVGYDPGSRVVWRGGPATR